MTMSSTEEWTAEEEVDEWAGDAVVEVHEEDRPSSIFSRISLIRLKRQCQRGDHPQFKPYLGILKLSNNLFLRGDGRRRLLGLVSRRLTILFQD